MLYAKLPDGDARRALRHLLRGRPSRRDLRPLPAPDVLPRRGGRARVALARGEPAVPRPVLARAAPGRPLPHPGAVAHHRRDRRDHAHLRPRRRESRLDRHQAPDARLCRRHDRVRVDDRRQARVEVAAERGHPHGRHARLQSAPRAGALVPAEPPRVQAHRRHALREGRLRMIAPAPDVALCRVLLFTPGNRPDRFAKAAATGADGLILDLEDAVSARRQGRGPRDARRALPRRASPRPRAGAGLRAAREQHPYRRRGARPRRARHRPASCPTSSCCRRWSRRSRCGCMRGCSPGSRSSARSNRRAGWKPRPKSRTPTRACARSRSAAWISPPTCAPSSPGSRSCGGGRASCRRRRPRASPRSTSRTSSSTTRPGCGATRCARRRWATRRSSPSIRSRCRPSSRSSRPRRPRSSARAASWQPARRRAGTWSSTRGRWSTARS